MPLFQYLYQAAENKPLHLNPHDIPYVLLDPAWNITTATIIQSSWFSLPEWTMTLVWDNVWWAQPTTPNLEGSIWLVPCYLSKPFL